MRVGGASSAALGRWVAGAFNVVVVRVCGEKSMGAMGLRLTVYLIRICKCRFRIGTLLIHTIKVQWEAFLFVGRHVYHNLVHGLGKCVCVCVCEYESVCLCVCVSTLVTTPIRIPLLLTIHLLCPTNIFNAIFALIWLLFSPANNNN